MDRMCVYVCRIIITNQITKHSFVQGQILCNRCIVVDIDIDVDANRNSKHH